MVDWSYFNKFDKVTEKYLPTMGEGETRASQIVTAVSKLVYKWYNDGDVYDNTGSMSGWYNDLSSYANWLAEYYPQTKMVLDRVYYVDEDGYEKTLKMLADRMLDENFLEKEKHRKVVGSIYTATGDYKFVDWDEEYEDDEDWEDEEDY